MLLRRGFTSFSLNNLQAAKVKNTLGLALRNSRRQNPFKKQTTPDKLEELGIDKDVHLKLSKLLGLDHKKTVKIVAAYPKFKDNNFMNVVEQRVSYLEQKNIDKERIARFLWLIYLPTEFVEERTASISSRLNLEFEEAVSLLKIANLPWLEKTTNMWDLERKTEEEFTRPGCLYRHRIDFIADRLECKPYAVTDIMAQFLGYSEQPFDRIRLTLRLLLDEARIHVNEIAKFPGILLWDTNLLEERIKILQDHKVPQITSHLIRKSKQEFELYAANFAEISPILQAHSDLIQFFEDQLKCDKRTARNIVTKVKRLTKMDHSVIERRIKLLQSQGLHLDDIPGVAPVLCANDSEIEENFQRLKSMNVPEENLVEFCILVMIRKYPVDNRISLVEDKYQDEEYFKDEIVY